MKCIAYRALAGSAVLAMAAVATPALAAGPTGPEVAPAGQKWTTCQFQYGFLRPRFGGGVVQSGPWLMNLSDPVSDSELREHGATFYKEYMALPERFATEVPGAKADPASASCSINQKLADRHYYNERRTKSPGYVNTAFKPSFAK